MRYLLIALTILLCPVSTGYADVSVGVGVPGINIGINMPAYPDLVPVPGYPVYYDPDIDANYFFYDGLYWVFENGQWYASSWYDGPWRLVDPYDVPVFLLRIPVRYYRRPPPFFLGWRPDLPPHWGEHWGHRWEHRRGGWEHWNRHAVPRRAPLPRYQREYRGERYPRAPQERFSIRSHQYPYRPHERITRQRFEQEGGGGRDQRGGRFHPGGGHDRSVRNRSVDNRGGRAGGRDHGEHNHGNQNDSRSHGNGQQVRDRHQQ